MFPSCTAVRETSAAVSHSPHLITPSLSPSLSPSPLAIHAKEHASTKKLVSNSLALNLVTQLYQMGAIEAAKAPGTKKPADLVELC